MTRNQIWITSIIGLVGAILTMAFSLLAVSQGWVTPFITRTIFLIAIIFFLGIFSVAEIPFMIFGIRHILKSEDPRAPTLALFTNTIYVFFAGIYAAPYILLTGEFWGGLALTAIAVIRFTTSILYLPHE